MRCILLLLFCLLGRIAFSQVEIFRHEQDTSTYIPPEDTITRPPTFETGDEDFFRYIETHFNIRMVGSSMILSGEIIKFQFYVEKSGNITDYKQISGTNPIVSTEMERIVTGMPDWNPGYFEGKKRRTLMVYDLKVREVIGAVVPVEVTKNSMSAEYTDKTKQIKWFMATGAILILASLWIRSFL